MHTEVKIKFHTIPIWERKGFFGRLQITKEKQDWDRDERTLLQVLAIKEKKKTLPKNIKEINKAMADSHGAQSAGYRRRFPFAAVVDIKFMLEQIIL